MAHLVILPYYCKEEIARYLKIARLLKQFGPSEQEYEFVLASSPRTQPSRELFDAFSKLAPTRAFACPTQVFGYPEGPTAMFWDCMDYLAEQDIGDGFGLWLESDMVPVKSNWLDHLSNEWYEQPKRPLVMGCLIPDIYKYRLFRPRRQTAAAHINGGACYAKDFASKMPAAARQGTFDMATYPYLQEMGGGHVTDLITLSSVKYAGRDIRRRSPVLLHGFFQKKDVFVDKCVRIAQTNTKTNVEPGLVSHLYDQTLRRMKVGLMRRGRRAFIETLLFQMDLKMAKEKRSREKLLPVSQKLANSSPDQLFNGQRT